MDFLIDSCWLLPDLLLGYRDRTMRSRSRSDQLHSPSGKVSLTMKIILLLALLLAGSCFSAVSNPFVKGEYVIHPYAIRKLDSWLSDAYPNVASIFTTRSLNNSNEYSDKVTGSPDTYLISYTKPADDGRREGYGYKVIGLTSDNLYIVHAFDITSGSGTFHRLFALESSRIQVNRYGEPTVEDILTLRGYHALGDRFNGDIKIKGDSVAVDGVSQLNRKVKFSWSPLGDNSSSAGEGL